MTQSKSPSAPPRSFWGRVLIHGVFWTLAAIPTAQLLGGVAVQLYAKPPPSAQVSQNERWCLTSLVNLRDELDHQITLELQKPAKNSPPLQRFDTWRELFNENLSTARSQCEGLSPEFGDAYQTLGELAGSYSESVRHIIRGRGTLRPSLDEQIIGLTRAPR